MATLSELVQKVITRISQVPGTGVQLYAEDRIADMIQQAFDFIFDDYFWPQFYFEQTYTLDGTTGVITGDISSGIKRYEDIQYIFFESDTYPLKELPRNYNPSLITGTRGRFFKPNSTAAKRFTVLPAASAGTVRVIGRTKPANFTDDDAVDFDNTAIILAATKDYLEDDGANPGAIEKFEQMFESRLAQLKTNQDSHPRALDPRVEFNNDEWREI